MLIPARYSNGHNVPQKLDWDKSIIVQSPTPKSLPQKTAIYPHIYQ